MVIVKCGAGVDYAEKDSSPYLSIGDIRQDFRLGTWKEEINSQQKQMFKDLDDDPFSDDEDDYEGAEPVIVDTYVHVNEYTWPPFHFTSDDC